MKLNGAYRRIGALRHEIGEIDPWLPQSLIYFLFLLFTLHLFLESGLLFVWNAKISKPIYLHFQDREELPSRRAPSLLGLLFVFRFLQEVFLLRSSPFLEPKDSVLDRTLTPSIVSLELTLGLKNKIKIDLYLWHNKIKLKLHIGKLFFKNIISLKSRLILLIVYCSVGR